MTASREIWVGEVAHLSSLRAGIQAHAMEVALQQLMDSSLQEETILCQVESVQVRFENCSSDHPMFASGDGGDNGDDDDDDSDVETNNIEDNNENFQRSLWGELMSSKQSIEGLMIVTTLRILFCSKEQVTFDFSIDAGCINLHALSNEPCSSVFVQVENGDGDDELPVDITFVPSTGDESQCQIIFDALSQLVSLHPILPNDDDDDEEDEGGDDLMMLANSSTPRQTLLEDDYSATDEERESMLRRLDNLLIVPPELEVVGDDGQFDDADESEDADEDLL